MFKAIIVGSLTLVLTVAGCCCERAWCAGRHGSCPQCGTKINCLDCAQRPGAMPGNAVWGNCAQNAPAANCCGTCQKGDAAMACGQNATTGNKACPMPGKQMANCPMMQGNASGMGASRQACPVSNGKAACPMTGKHKAMPQNPAMILVMPAPAAAPGDSMMAPVNNAPGTANGAMMPMLNPAGTTATPAHSVAPTAPAAPTASGAVTPPASAGGNDDVLVLEADEELITQ